MAETDTLPDFFFDLYITSAGPYFGEPFRKIAEQAFAAITDESEIFRGWGLSALMVRSGLLLCKRRDPGLYHDFLTAGLIALKKERERLLGDGTGLGDVWSLDWDVLAIETEFFQLGERILDDRIIDEPRAVAWAMVVEGLEFCQRRAPDRARGLLLKTSMLMLEESERVEGGARRILPRNAPPARSTPRIYQVLFNRAARLPADA
jgi:hypothetical protein